MVGGAPNERPCRLKHLNATNAPCAGKDKFLAHNDCGIWPLNNLGIILVKGKTLVMDRLWSGDGPHVMDPLVLNKKNKALTNAHEQFTGS